MYKAKFVHAQVVVCNCAIIHLRIRPFSCSPCQPISQVVAPVVSEVLGICEGRSVLVGFDLDDSDAAWPTLEGLAQEVPEVSIGSRGVMMSPPGKAIHHIL